MKLSHLLAGSASRLALAAAATLASASLQPAAAANSGVIFSGGSSLFSQAGRALYDCYMGVVAIPLTTCNAAGAGQTNVTGEYASVGSGSGTRAFVTNDTHELLIGGGPFTLPVNLPATPPAYLVSPIVSYPYTDAGHSYHLDAGFSDAPLKTPVASLTVSAHTPGGAWTPASNWQTFLGTLTTPAVQNVAYNSAKFGAPIQLPVAAVALDIGVNIPYPNSGVWQVKTQTQTIEPLTGKIIQAPIHLNPAQVCAIFTGKVTDWRDNTTRITYLTSDYYGATATLPFSGFNTPVAVAYATTSTPIKLVYRSDKSGTTYILTNFLKSYCLVLGAGYSWLNTTSLPTTDFNGVFKPLVAANGGNTTNWIGATEDQNAARTIVSTVGGIGYIGNGFTKPYFPAAGSDPGGPNAAAIANEAQRTAGIYTPSAATPFTIPTIASTVAAWNALPAPTTAAYADYDVYSKTRMYPPFTGASPLPATVGYLAVPPVTATTAYPLTGATFLLTYSCFASANRETLLTDYLSWLYNASLSNPAGTPATTTRNSALTDLSVRLTLWQKGFAPVPSSWANPILTNFVKSGAATSIKSLPGATNGCTGVTGGA